MYCYNIDAKGLRIEFAGLRVQQCQTHSNGYPIMQFSLQYEFTYGKAKDQVAVLAILDAAPKCDRAAALA